MPTHHHAAYALDPARLTLNHGSFGACTRTTLTHQDRLRAELESDPTGFFEERFPALMHETRARVAAFVGADPAGLVFVTNATMGVSTVLGSLCRGPSPVLGRGDQIVTTNHVYPACRNALAAYGADVGAELVIAEIPFPISEPGRVEAEVLARITPRTRLVLLDHVTSPTGLVFPIAPLVSALEARGISVLVDGAHAPGMIPLDLEALGASYYTGNLHKWVGGPKSSAFLWAREDRRKGLRPLVVSHGHGRGLHAEFDWTGTFDPTALFSVGAALDSLATAHPEGVPGVMAGNRRAALRAQDVLSRALGIEPPAPASMIGSLVSMPLPPTGAPMTTQWPPEKDTDRAVLERDLRTRVPFFPWGTGRLFRISLAVYVSDDDVRVLADWLRARWPA